MQKRSSFARKLLFKAFSSCFEHRGRAPVVRFARFASISLPIPFLTLPGAEETPFSHSGSDHNEGNFRAKVPIDGQVWEPGGDLSKVHHRQRAD